MMYKLDKLLAQQSLTKQVNFLFWAKQFKAVKQSHINEFMYLDFSLYELKQKFSEKYQDLISFSYLLEVELKLIKEVHLNFIISNFHDLIPNEYPDTEVNGSGFGVDDLYGSYDPDGCLEIEDSVFRFLGEGFYGFHYQQSGQYLHEPYSPDKYGYNDEDGSGASIFYFQHFDGSWEEK